MKQENTQKKMDRFLEELVCDEKVPMLLLQSCCGPCSSYVIDYLSQYFFITVFFYNPNIFPQNEYEKRKAEQKRLIAEMPTKHPVKFLEGEYAPEKFESLAGDLEDEPEGGERCTRCYAMRLAETAKQAKLADFDYFTTTLSVSPYKNAEKLNYLGRKIGEQEGVPYLEADFKKKEGYKKSIALSREYQLYRQDFCGCRFSFEAYEKKKQEVEL